MRRDQMAAGGQLQPAGHGEQQPVAGLLTEIVADRVEVVDVKDADPHPLGPVIGEGAVQPLLGDGRGSATG